MRRIVSEDTASAEAVHGTRERQLPQAGIYAPNYHAVNQLLVSPGGNGRINFMSVLSNISGKTIADQQNLYDAMEVNDGISQVDIAYRKEEEKFFNENPTGKGYMEFATGKYSELSDEVTTNASNANVRDRMKLIFDSRKKDIANNAFQKEKELYTGYALNEIETKLNSTINEVTNTPDQAISLSDKFNMQLEGMRNILNAADFQKYSVLKNQEFTEAYGLGLIHQDPYRAQALLKGEQFKTLPNNRYIFLKNQAGREIDHRERQAKMLQHMQMQAKRETDFMLKFDMANAIETGGVSEGDIKSSGLSERDQQYLQLKLRKYTIKREQENAIESGIDDCINKGIPTTALSDIEISKADKDRYISRFFLNQNEKRASEGLPLMSLSEKVKYLSDNSIVFDKVYEPLQSQISDTIMHSTNSKDVMDACIAISGCRAPALGKIDSRLKDFADFAIVYYQGSKNAEGLIARRQEFFDDPKNYNVDIWKNTDFYESPDDEFEKFCDERDIDLKSHWFEWGETTAIRKANAAEIQGRVESIIERVTKQTGSIDTAKAVASRYLQNLVRKTEINGKEAQMINPPTTENTGFSDKQIKNILYGCGREFFEKKIKNKDRARYINELIDQEKEEPQPTIEVEIDGKKVKRKLMFEHASLSAPQYNVYYLIDEKNPDSKEFLLDKLGKREVINFSSIKRAIRKRSN